MGEGAAPREALFRPGETCWRVAPARRLAFLRNADAYYHELARAIASARRSVWILAWDFDHRIQLTRGRQDDALPPRSLGELLLARVEEAPELEVRILVWDKAPLFTKTGDAPDVLEAFRLEHPRIGVRLDAAHPSFSSPHQKVAVVDDMLAFCGGIDITQARWDTARHEPEDERRRMPDGSAYRPYHDVQVLVQGEAAACLGALARERWRRSVPGTLSELGLGDEAEEDGAAEFGPTELPEDEAREADAGTLAAWPEGLAPDLERVPVAISRTRPAWRDLPELREIERMLHEIISGARQAIFVEQQYFTDEGICEALCDRLREPEGPELVLILPRDTTGWLARLTMESVLPLRLHQLVEADRHGRLSVLYPDAPGIPEEHGGSINVHAKLLVADDRRLCVGSANLNRKSMSQDDECCLALDADAAEDEAHAREVERAIRGLRHAILAEHLGVSREDVASAEDEAGGWGAAVERLAEAEGPTLRPFDPALPGWLLDLLAALPLARFRRGRPRHHPSVPEDA